MAAGNNHKNGDEKMRVLRIAHSSLTPALRHRERALARGYPNVDLGGGYHSALAGSRSGR